MVYFSTKVKPSNPHAINLSASQTKTAIYKRFPSRLGRREGIPDVNDTRVCE